jgi:predicted dehydrogenase
MKQAAVAGAGLLIVKPQVVRGTQANSAIRLGIIGCGGRGNSVGADLVRNTDTRVVALMDLFDDRLNPTRERFDKMAEERGQAKISPSMIFKGHRAYQQLVQSDLDAVLITSPPYFHPEQFEAAVAAGKHVYLEKPVATDVHGCKRVMKTGERAQGKVTVHVGFQTRFAPPFREMVERVHSGAIGDIACVQAYYYSGDLGRRAKPGMSPVEARIRNWVFDKVLSGDILVEQNIHIVDVCNWVLKSHPIKATGTCGRKARTDVGDVNDHFITTFSYPGDVHVSLNSTQFIKGWSDMAERFFGTKGVAETHYRGGVRIVGDNPWDSGVDNTLERAVPEKVKAFIESIKNGKLENEAAQGAESTLTAIMGRTAAYKGKEVTWEKIIKSDDKWDAKLNLDSLGVSEP